MSAQPIDRRSTKAHDAHGHNTKKEEQCAPIPEVIEEKRKDPSGRVVVVNRYLRGIMLGKVSTVLPTWPPWAG